MDFVGQMVALLAGIHVLVKQEMFVQFANFFKNYLPSSALLHCRYLVVWERCVEQQ